jgi:putative oxidoreductase
MTVPASRVFDRWALRYARWALGAAFLSGIASRFGWWGPGRGYGTFANFMKYTAQVNSFMPARTIPFLAWAATVAEFTLGLALLLPLRGRVARGVALASAALLAVFGLAMAVSFGPKEPLDYSVFSASAAALLLARGPDPEAP